MANLSWQTRVGKLRKVDKLFPSHVKLVSNNEHGNYLQHGNLVPRVSYLKMRDPGNEVGDMAVF